MGSWRELHHGALGDEIAADLQANGAYVTRKMRGGADPRGGAGVGYAW